MDPQQDRQNSQTAKHILLTSLIHQGCLTTLLWTSQENYFHHILSTNCKASTFHSHCYLFYSFNLNQLTSLLTGWVASIPPATREDTQKSLISHSLAYFSYKALREINTSIKSKVILRTYAVSIPHLIRV